MANLPVQTHKMSFDIWFLFFSFKRQNVTVSNWEQDKYWKIIYRYVNIDIDINENV